MCRCLASRQARLPAAGHFACNVGFAGACWTCGSGGIGPDCACAYRSPAPTDESTAAGCGGPAVLGPAGLDEGARTGRKPRRQDPRPRSKELGSNPRRGGNDNCLAIARTNRPADIGLRAGYRSGHRACPGPIGLDRQPPLPGIDRRRGVVAQNTETSNASSVVFTPLTDSLSALNLQRMPPLA